MHVTPQRCGYKALFFIAERIGKLEKALFAPEFFLAHIVVKASARYSDIACERCEQDHAPVHEIIVIIVVYPRALDDPGRFCSREVTGDASDKTGNYTGDAGNAFRIVVFELVSEQ
ncbi:Uncharacterised protein [uncultured archaeon]|nr:Uncharacterised protein [uncultured archaeon]